MNHSQDKARLDTLLEVFKAQPVGSGYIDIIVSRLNWSEFVKALIDAGFGIEGISWWEYVPDTKTSPSYGMGGPRSMFYDGWFAETCREIDDIPIIDNPDQAIRSVIQIVENKCLGVYSGIQISYKDTPSLTPAFWLRVDASWRNTQTKKNEPNKALEPTRMLVTDRAYARSAPSIRAAQLKRSRKI